MTAHETVLRACGVYKVFVARGGKARTALRDVDLEVRRGEFMCLIGPSGCGKTTVLNMFAGLVQPSDGTILHEGRVVDAVNTRVGYVTQDDNLLPWRSVIGNVELALECKGVPRAERRERARDYVGRVGLEGLEELYPHELSGGMRKRVSIARTLVDDSVHVILMDEPFGPLDAQTRIILQDELLRLWQGTGRHHRLCHARPDRSHRAQRPHRNLHQRSRVDQRHPRSSAAAPTGRLSHTRDLGLQRHLRRNLERPAGRNPQDAARCHRLTPRPRYSSANDHFWPVRRVRSQHAGDGRRRAFSPCNRACSLSCLWRGGRLRALWSIRCFSVIRSPWRVRFFRSPSMARCGGISNGR